MGPVETKLDHVASEVEALDPKGDAEHWSLGAWPDRAPAHDATNLQMILAALRDEPVQGRSCPC